MQLSEEVINQLKMRQAVINQQELIVNALKLELASYLQLACGVDISQGNYMLDLEIGTLCLTTS